MTSLGLVYSQSILTALVEAGMNRDEAYRIVQRDSRSAIDQRRNFREVIEGDDEVELTEAQIARAFDLDRLLTHRRRILSSLTWIS